MAGTNKPQKPSYPFRFAFGTPMGQRVWREIMEKSAAEIRAALSGRAEAARLEVALNAVWDGRHLEGYLQGVVEGYKSARLLLKGRHHTETIAKIVGRHPDWTAKQICRRLDVLGKKIPRAYLKKNEEPRLWEDAVNERNSRLARMIEKRISRIRIASRFISRARNWKGYVKTGILP